MSGQVIGVQRLLANTGVPCGDPDCDKLAELTFELDDETYFMCEESLRKHAFKLADVEDGEA